MAYFSYIPDVQWDNKPISYPFSESDFTVAKNFFRRYKLNEKIFDSSTYYTEYALQDGDRPDTVANQFYGNPFYDWILLLTNNTINPLFDWPMSEYELRKYAEAAYEDPYSEIVQYRTISEADQKAIYGQVVVEPDLVVDEQFYTSNATWTWQDPPAQVNLSIDLTDETNFADIGVDVAVVPTGTGIGQTGGFDIGTHLKFGSESSNPGSSDGHTSSSSRYVTLTTQNLEPFLQVRLKAIRGNNFNGGETPDAANEDLYFRVFDSQGNLLLTQVIIGTSNDVETEADATNELLINYTVTLPQAARIPNATMQLYQPVDSGDDYDHYGLIEFTYLADPSYTPYTTYEKIDDKNYLIDGVLYQYVVDETTEQQRWGIRQSEGYIFYDPVIGRTREIAGSSLSRRVTALEYESEKNEKNRTLFVLKPDYISAFIEEFRRNHQYKNSGGFVSSRLKKSGV